MSLGQHSEAKLQIFETQPTDAAILAELMREAAEVMVEKGVEQWKPEMFTEETVRRYFYLHRLTVRPLYRGRDYGSFMLHYAEEEAVRADKDGLRLDCVAHLPSLNAYYVRSGFRLVAERDLNREVGGRYVNLYEKLLPR